MGTARLTKTRSEGKKPPPELRRMAELGDIVQNALDEFTDISVKLHRSMYPTWWSAVLGISRDNTRRLEAGFESACLTECADRRTADKDRGMSVKEAADLLGLSETEVRRIDERDPAALGRRDYGNSRIVLSEKAVLAYGRRSRWVFTR